MHLVIILRKRHCHDSMQKHWSLYDKNCTLEDADSAVKTIVTLFNA